MNLNESMQSFANKILDAFDFDDDHLSAFYMGDRCFDVRTEICCKNFMGDAADTMNPMADEVFLEDLGLYKGKKFFYLYDFGDCWTFKISVLKFSPEKCTGPMVIKRVGSIKQYPDWDYDEESLEDEEELLEDEEE